MSSMLGMSSASSNTITYTIEKENVLRLLMGGNVIKLLMGEMYNQGVVHI